MVKGMTATQISAAIGEDGFGALSDGGDNLQRHFLQTLLVGLGRAEGSGFAFRHGGA